MRRVALGADGLGDWLMEWSGAALLAAGVVGAQPTNAAKQVMKASRRITVRSLTPVERCANMLRKSMCRTLTAAHCGTNAVANCRAAGEWKPPLSSRTFSDHLGQSADEQRPFPWPCHPWADQPGRTYRVVISNVGRRDPDASRGYQDERPHHVVEDALRQVVVRTAVRFCDKVAAVSEFDYVQRLDTACANATSSVISYS